MHGIGPKPLASYLGRVASGNPASPAELELLRSKVWTESGIVCIHPDEIDNEFVRQGLINTATKRFGKRMKRGGR